MDMDLENTAVGYAYLDDQALKRSLRLFQAMSLPFLSQIGPKILSLAFQYHIPIPSFFLKDLFEHFCAGESLDQALILVKKLKQYQVQAVLDYGVEAIDTEEGFEATKQAVFKNLAFAHSNPELIPFSVIKVTSLASHGILAKVSQKIPLSKEEALSWDRAQKRIRDIFLFVKDHRLKLLIDAEESWINEAIENLVWEGVSLCNHSDASIYVTMQMYLRENEKKLLHWIERSKQEKLYLGVKLVRGAYHDQEREYAKKTKKPCPVFLKKEETDESFDRAVAACLQAKDMTTLFLGTHNLDSTKKAIRSNEKNIYFSQLLGMSDPLTFNLARAGFLVCKYVPYGPMNKTIPYLMRRAQENRSIGAQANRELSHLCKEQLRRKNI